MKIAFKNSKILMINGRTLTPVPGIGPEPGLHYVYTSSEGHGSISASPMSGKKNTLITLSNTPDQNYIFSKYTLNNVDLAGSSFLMPDEDAYVRGYFQPDVRTITVTQPSHGTITAPASAQIGSTVTLTCTPDSGYALQYFTVNGTKIQGNSFVMPASNVTVSASLAEDTSWKTTIYTRAASATSANSPLQFTNTTQVGEYVVYEFDVKTPTLFIGSNPYHFSYSGYIGNVHGCRIEPNYICRSKVRYGKTDSSASDYSDFQYPTCYNGAAVDSGSYRGTYWIYKSGVWGSDWHHVKIVYRWYQYTDPVVGQRWKGEAEFLIDGSVMFTSTDGSTDAYLGDSDKIYLESSTEIKNIEIYKTSDRSKVWVNP